MPMLGKLASGTAYARTLLPSFSGKESTYGPC